MSQAHHQSRSVSVMTSDSGSGAVHADCPSLSSTTFLTSHSPSPVESHAQHLRSPVSVFTHSPLSSIAIHRVADHHLPSHSDTSPPSLFSSKSSRMGSLSAMNRVPWGGAVRALLLALFLCLCLSSRVGALPPRMVDLVTPPLAASASIPLPLTYAVVLFSLDISSPGGIATDSLGFVYVSDTNRGRVLKLSPYGSIVQIFSAQPLFTSPGHLALDSADNLFVQDANRVVQLAPNGTQLNQLFSPNRTALRNVAVDSSDLVYLSDSAAIYQFNSSADLVQTIYPPYRAEGQLVIDREGFLYTTISTGQSGFRVVKLSPTTNSTVLQTVVTNTGKGLALAANGNLHVQAGVQVYVYAADGVYINTAPLTPQPYLNTPAAMAVDPSNNIWVADTFNNRIVQYKVVTSTSPYPSSSSAPPALALSSTWPSPLSSSSSGGRQSSDSNDSAGAHDGIGSWQVGVLVMVAVLCGVAIGFGLGWCRGRRLDMEKQSEMNEGLVE